MKAVILCAGKSTRTYPLTVNKTKPLLRVGDKLLIEHLLDRLSSVAKEVVLVVSDNDVKKKLGDKYGKIKLVYAKQKEALGTGDALLCAEKFVDNDENFMILMGDNLYPEKSIKECASYGVSMLSQKAIDPENYGVLDIDKGFLISIDEKPSKPKSNMINTGLYVLNKRVFDVLKSVDRSKRKEYELTDAVNTLAGKIRIRCFY
ncbi:MAG: NTP transferase domain-containing protein, partial [Candidatus Peribacteraceae bacterium]|nr:NTP transferase domain-containing protein [Candidatus Peribacteraceae bacterium]